MAEIPPLPTHLTLEIVTPDRVVVAEEVDEVNLPGVEGYFGVLPGHTPLLAMLQAGELWFRQGRDAYYTAIASGFAEVLPDRVTVLADAAERAEEIDTARAENARRRAEERLADPPADLDADRARLALVKATVRIQVATRVRARA